MPSTDLSSVIRPLVEIAALGMSDLRANLRKSLEIKAQTVAVATV
jgi:hypothetical protein